MCSGSISPGCPVWPVTLTVDLDSPSLQAQMPCIPWLFSISDPLCWYIILGLFLFVFCFAFNPSIFVIYNSFILFFKKGTYNSLKTSVRLEMYTTPHKFASILRPFTFWSSVFLNLGTHVHFEPFLPFSLLIRSKRVLSGKSMLYLDKALPDFLLSSFWYPVSAFLGLGSAVLSKGILLYISCHGLLQPIHSVCAHINRPILLQSVISSHRDTKSFGAP